MAKETVIKMHAQRSMADWFAIRVLTLLLPKNRRANRSVTKTMALASVPVVPVTSPTTMDAIGNAGGCGGRFPTFASVVNS